MRRSIILAALMCMFATVANASWESQELEDPMTDEKSAWIGTGSKDNSLSILYKCWDDVDKTKWLAILTTEDYDDSASYKSIINIRLRFDKNQVQEVPFAIEKFDGKVTFVTSPAVGSAFDDLERELFNTQSRVVVEINNMATLFPAGSIKQPLQKVLKACGLQNNS